jgi:hypothetical protein
MARPILKIIFFLLSFSVAVLKGLAASPFSHGKLCISENRRFLMHEDGTPFFYLGDTAWELFHRLNEEEIEIYLEDRRAKGFTVIQAVILAELDGLNTPDKNGNIPFINNNPEQPDETYFAWIDRIIRMAEAKGLYIGLLPTWGDKVDRQWGIGPVIFDVENATVYGKFLANRYKNFPNIIWINGGDRKGGGNNFAVWDALGKAIKSVDKNHLMTYHPSGEASSSQWFHHCDWLDFNVCQSSHSQTGYAIYRRLLIPDYELMPVKPCMDAEPRYEDIPVAFKEENRRFDAADVRQALYWSLFSGAFGFVYGCNDIWQFYTENETPNAFARNQWQTALQFPGSFQMIHARNLLMKYDFFSRIPDQSILIGKQNDDADMAVATRGKGYAWVYLPNGNEIEISLEKIKNAKCLRLAWLNPKTGTTTQIMETKAKGTLKIKPPTSGRGNDWILIMEEKN